MKSLENFAGALASVLCLAILAGSPNDAAAESREFSTIVAFGDSLMDPGNAYALTGEVAQKPYLLIPARPYAIGAFHFSNGHTWIEQLGRWLGTGTSTGPAFKTGIDASNYAVGGSTARDGGSPFSANVQIATYLSSGQPIPADALFVYGFGGNDVRNALAAMNPQLVGAAVSSTVNNLLTLCTNGARTILIANTPNVGVAPAPQIIGGPAVAGAATALSQALNNGVASMLDAVVVPNCPHTDFIVLDAFDLSSRVAADPSEFGFSTLEACLNFGEVANPICADPHEHFFWDGIHPTRSGHALLASEALAVLASQ